MSALLERNTDVYLSSTNLETAFPLHVTVSSDDEDGDGVRLRQLSSRGVACTRSAIYILRAHPVHQRHLFLSGAHTTP